MKKILAAAALALAITAAPPAFADSVPYATTRTENGQQVRVYTNPGTAQFKQRIQSQGSVYTNPAAPPKVKHKRVAVAPRPAAPAASAALAGASLPARYKATDDAGYPRYVSTWSVVNGEFKPVTVDLHAEVDRLARAYDLDPLLIKELIRQESNFNADAQSWVGAIGLMQLMPETAEYLGVNPYDPVQNLQGGVAYLAEQMRAFGDVRLALAAYNAGPGAVYDYGGVPPYEETQNYVAVIYSGYVASRQARR